MEYKNFKNGYKVFRAKKVSIFPRAIDEYRYFIDLHWGKVGIYVVGTSWFNAIFLFIKHVWYNTYYG